MAATTVVPTIVPPAFAHDYAPFDRHQFMRPAKPVCTTHREADGTKVNANRLGFDDVARGIHVEVHTLGRRRRLQTPSWALNTSELRRVLLYFYQRRAGIKSPQISDSVEEQRQLLRIAQQRLEAVKVPELKARLDSLCRRYVGTNDPAARNALARQIHHVDQSLLTIARGPALILAIVYAYFYRRLNATETGNELHVQSVFCRQVLHRLNVTWARMNKQAFIPHYWRPYSETERP